MAKGMPLTHTPHHMRTTLHIPHGYSGPHPYPYGGYDPTYLASSSRARRARLISPPSGRSKSSKNMEAQCERNIENAATGVVQVDQYVPKAMAGTVAVASTSPVASAHAPVVTAPTPGINAHSKEDGLPLSQVFRITASHERPDENVNFHPNPYNCFALYWPMCPYMLHIVFYIKHELTTMCMPASDMWHYHAIVKSRSAPT